MNDFDELPPEDEDVQAVLDGTASEAQRARVENDPTRRQDLARQRQVRAELADLPLLPEAVARRTLQAALAAFDDGLTDADAPTPGALPGGATGAGSAPMPVTLDSRRPATRTPRPSDGPRRMPSVAWFGAAAAVVALVAVGASALGDRDGQGGSDAAATALATPDAARVAEMAPAHDDASAATTAGAGATLPPSEALALPSLPDLGAQADPDALLAAIEARGLLEDAARSAPDGRTAAEQQKQRQCTDEALDDSAAGQADLLARAVYQGRAVLILAVHASPGAPPDHVAVMADPDCALLERIPLG